MRKIFKYPFMITDHFTLALPLHAEILTANMQHDEPCLWTLVDPEQPLEMRAFKLIGTGHLIEDTNKNLHYINTFQMHDGDFIWHLFEML